MTLFAIPLQHYTFPCNHLESNGWTMHQEGRTLHCTGEDLWLKMKALSWFNLIIPQLCFKVLKMRVKGTSTCDCGSAAAEARESHFLKKIKLKLIIYIFRLLFPVSAEEKGNPYRMSRAENRHLVNKCGGAVGLKIRNIKSAFVYVLGRSGRE